jgi:hypothetical protein
MMAHFNGWSDEDEREATDRAELAAGGARRQPRRPYRERLLRAVVREILGHGPGLHADRARTVENAMWNRAGGGAGSGSAGLRATQSRAKGGSRR